MYVASIVIETIQILYDLLLTKEKSTLMWEAVGSVGGVEEVREWREWGYPRKENQVPLAQIYSRK